MTNRSKGIAAIVVSAMGFALMAACVRLCDDYGSAIPCFEKSFFRNIVALLVAAIVFIQHRNSQLSPAKHNRLDSRTALLLTVRCILGTVGIFSNFYALGKIPIADGQTLNKTAPFFTVLFSWLCLGEKANLRQLSAVGIAFAGTVLVAKPGFAGADAFPLTMGLLGGICAGSAYTALHALGARKTLQPSLIVFVFSAFSCLVSIPFTCATYTPLNIAQLLILVGAGIGAALGQFGITLAYRYAAPREIAVFDYSNIIFTALLGFALFDQISDVYSILGMVIIIAAALLLHHRTSPR